nr:hypothetical protein [uncultured Pseudomonas sp.]
MAKQNINLGTTPNGAGGDTPRSAFTKVQANIDELYAALGAPASGALPSALPVIDGGTGSTSVAGARANLGLKTAALVNIVGTVAAGDIMEVGANANGTYFKLANGLMICRGEFTGYAAGVLKTVNLPMPFVDGSNGCAVSIIPSTGYEGSATWWCDSTRFNFYSPNARGANTVVYVAIGKWN